MEEKMLREIANAHITPKKTIKIVQNDLYERQEEDELDYEDQYTVLNEF